MQNYDGDLRDSRERESMLGCSQSDRRPNPNESGRPRAAPYPAGVRAVGCGCCTCTDLNHALLFPSFVSLHRSIQNPKRAAGRPGHACILSRTAGPGGRPAGMPQEHRHGRDTLSCRRHRLPGRPPDACSNQLARLHRCLLACPRPISFRFSQGRQPALHSSTGGVMVPAGNDASQSPSARY